MAIEPHLTPELLAKFGPLRSYPTGQRLDAAVDPDRVVKTHCCFCGQQCGIQLKVKDNEVIGFEPWEDFPFNRGMLCPKGVRRYLQGSHHDRLTSALVAYGQQCSHLSCAVVPAPEQDRLRCPCHNGFFEIREGRPVAGPPRRPLPRIKLEVRGGVIYATGVELRTV
jgi:Rieske Fe-S protein